MNENKIKHLEFLQNIITRMNTNSFQIKTFCITLISAIFAIVVSSQNEYFLLIGIFPVFLFWFLDSYYLQQERKFRGVYNSVAGLKNNIKIKDFEMSIHKFKGGQFSYYSVFFSITIFLFYGFILFLLLVGFFLLRCVI